MLRRYRIDDKTETLYNLVPPSMELDRLDTWSVMARHKRRQIRDIRESGRRTC